MSEINSEMQNRLIVRLTEALRRKNEQIRVLTADNDRLRLENGQQADEIETLQTIVDGMLDEIDAERQQETAARAMNMTLALHLDMAMPRENHHE